MIALIGVGLFVLALLMETLLWRERPDKAWYDGRAVAESAKTLTWKFAVGGNPFPVTMSTTDATSALINRLTKVRLQFADLELASVNVPLMSAWMTEQRDSPFNDRRESYLDARIRDQKAWYDRNAKYNKRRARQWRTGPVTLEFAGAVASMIGAFAQTGLLLAPTLAAIAGAGVAWVESRQHDSLGRAYSAAVADLTSAEAKLVLVQNEKSWAVEVDDAEEAISREHTVWLASRSRV